MAILSANALILPPLHLVQKPSHAALNIIHGTAWRRRDLHLVPWRFGLTGRRGNLRVVVNVVIPRRLSAEQRELLEQLTETLTEENLRRLYEGWLSIHSYERPEQAP